MLNVLSFNTSTFRNMCNARYSCFPSSLISLFPSMLLRYCPNGSETVPFSPVIAGIAFVFTFRMHYISIVRSLYFRTFSVTFLITFLQHQLLLSLYLLFLSLLLLSSSSFCEAYYFNRVQILLPLKLSLITSKSIHTFDHRKERQINKMQPKCYFTFYESEITSTKAARFQTHEHFNTRNLKTIQWI